MICFMLFLLYMVTTSLVSSWCFLSTSLPKKNPGANFSMLFLLPLCKFTGCVGNVFLFRRVVFLPFVLAQHKTNASCSSGRPVFLSRQFGPWILVCICSIYLSILFNNQYFSDAQEINLLKVANCIIVVYFIKRGT
jgi:hypothetical protein|uniref:Uncharacterized protein n=1 Tax=Zea mays TaxID=4577 RepID=C0PIZ8_MAIZE|nr:unknown [Zea mays]